MTAKFFVDTNVLVYARDAAEPVKRPLATAWLQALWSAKSGCVSYQVLHEYYSVMTGKLAKGIPRPEARTHVRALLAWEVVASTDVLTEAWRMEERYKLSWWDSLIVGAAKVGGCDYLLSEDFSVGQNYSGVRVINPFATEPADVLR
jgi:predicted nucleic acid-binding protein